MKEIGDHHEEDQIEYLEKEKAATRIIIKKKVKVLA